MNVTASAGRRSALALETEIAKAIVGQQRAIRLIVIAIFSRGHVLIEGDVGVGKTTLLRAAARALGGDFVRVEGAVDMMPADLLYNSYLGDDGRPRVEPTPLLNKADRLAVFFFNEINRARPQVHSLLLRLMAEGQVSAFSRDYDFPFLQVFADRNMVEREETFELPAAARDRFLMEISIATPSDDASRRQLIFDPRFQDVDELLEQVRPGPLDFRDVPALARAIQRGVAVRPALQDYVLALWRAMAAPAKAGISLPGLDMETLVKGGASPRGLGFLIRAARVRAWLEDRDYVTPEDIRDLFVEVMAHRVFIDPIHAMRGEDPVKELCRAIFDRTPTP
ncbi:AAA family ATPase [Rhodoblastus sphagnicola]|uniref:AAA family ATPase n=1 Tax=Rhodoblastus sphagnicola TaxID=333368 RepID=A0A2S6NEH1_9HYPH|nr:MoxR family ATPase [Rhodoblastus sphagnicola]MBB4200158.1 MoxR-like ATPase [Rhodoblastus sphagnicola]PPQ32997.1 AAA family ATPase [Rhodoblastus sphagnicola]